MQKLHQSALRKGRVSLSGHVYAVTKCQNFQKNEEITQYKGLPELIIDSFIHCQKEKWFQMGAFVIMPDHYHLLFRLGELKTLDEIIHSINSYTSTKISKIFKVHPPFWQEGYYDHVIRSDESLFNQINYIEENPTRAKLTENVKDWTYSSANSKWNNLMDRSWIHP